jgi:uncharacterized protein (DUF2141 family)
VLSAAVLGAILTTTASGRQTNVLAVRSLRGLGGNSSISGQVLSGDYRPVWAATVAIRSQDTVLTRTVVTDDAGKFEFQNLPAGKFFVRALKAGYVASDFGSPSFGRPPQAIALEAGAAVSDVRIVMNRGAAIGGRLVERDGAPAVGIRVTAVTKQFLNGQPRFASGGATQTDDRGMYRLYGLAPATYAIVAGLRDVTSDRAPIERAADDDPPMAAARPMSIRVLGPNSAASYLNVFYPGTVDPAGLTWLTVRAGETRDDVNFSLRLTRAGTLSGEVLNAGGSRARSVRVVAYAETENMSLGSGDLGTQSATSPDGRFAFGGIQPGSYTVVATGGDGTNRLAAIARVRITGPSPAPITLTLGPATTISGRVALDSDTRRPPDLTSVRVLLRPLSESANEAVAASIQPNSDGAFFYWPVVPGTYLIDGMLQAPTPRLSEWRVKSATVGGRNLRAGAFRMVPGEQLSGVAVTLTDRTAELTGRLFDASGAPSWQRYVTLFAVDPSLWWTGSGHMRAPTRPATDGSFTFDRLPAGRYYLAVLNDFDSEAWLDRSFLSQLIPSALTIDLQEGERKTQDVRLR